ncbi:hypothetical protein [Thioalkalivibrio thiocyanodenitrificans]|uniref:hypothetical protein n=1 Tax=Thioalkalivibrio thiocyanodenitrificans TaxID=243063 RepID=UPI0003780CEC|nr:hypothetical protein [Thioalkalivibrio thiocyanodenitrificans]
MKNPSDSEILGFVMRHPAVLEHTGARTLLSRMSAKPMTRRHHPATGRDFATCVLLLNGFPGWRKRLDEMAQEQSGCWRALLQHWPLLERVLCEKGRDAAHEKLREVLDAPERNLAFQTILSRARNGVDYHA